MFLVLQSDFRFILTVGVLEFAAVMIFLSVSNRIFNTARGHAKDLPANQRQSWYTVTV